MQANTWKNQIIELFANQQPQLKLEVKQADKLSNKGTTSIALGLKEIGSQIEEFYFVLAYGKFTIVGCKSLGEAFATLSNAKLINFKMSNTKLKDEMTKEIMDGIAKCSELNQLSLSFLNIDFGKVGSNYIGESLLSLQKMTTIDIQFEFSNISSLGLSELCKSMSNCVNLESLKLSVYRDKINDEGMGGFQTLFSKTKRLQNLVLQLYPTNITLAGAKTLKNALSEAKQLKNVSFQLVDDSLNCLGWKEIFEGFKNYSSLTELEIKISHSGHYGRLVQEEGCKGLKTSLLTFQSLYKLDLDLSFALIDNNALKQIAEGIEKTEHLKDLKVTLFGNSFDHQGLEYLFHGIQKLEKLIYLTICQTHNYLVDQYIGNPIFSSLQSLQSIRVLRLTQLYINIRSENVPNLIACFMHLPNLVELRLNLNASSSLRTEDKIEILSGLGQVKSLNTLSVHFPTNLFLQLKSQEYYDFLLRRSLKLNRIVETSIYVNGSYVKLKTIL